MNWQYRIKTPGEKVRDPIQGEFFSTEAIKNPADALVREAIQNALDAKLKDKDGQPKEVLRVRFFLATGAHARPAQEVVKWFDGVWEHFDAEGNGLRDAPKKTDVCPWLVFEDFNTCGLEGDVTQSEPIDGEQNHFFYFFRAEGKSVEGGKERGRWGVGKCVFPRSSRANAFFGLTVRNGDNKRFLMGASVFKSHRVNEKYYCPDGYFGKLDDSGIVLPMDDPALLDEFSEEFQLRRRIEPGLSIVMPWIDPEITEKALIEAVVRGYFYPILTGTLSVTVEIPEKSTIIDKSNINEITLLLDEAESRDVRNLIDLAEWATTRQDQDFFKVELPDMLSPDWKKWMELIDIIGQEEELKLVKKALESGEKVAVCAPLCIRQKSEKPKLSSFSFFLWKDEFESGRPVFIREGLIISDVRAPRARGIRSLVVIGTGALGKLLGDAENPAHTEWQSKGENFHGKYTCGTMVLDYVTSAVANFVQILTSQDQEEDKHLLLDFFSLPAEKPEAESKLPEKKKKKKGAESDEVQPQLEPKRKRFRVQKSQGGFTVTNGDAGTQPPARLNIMVAYDVRRPRPLKKYNTADFRLNQAPIRLEPPPNGLKIITKEENRMVVEVLDPFFCLTVVGFDEKRDLFVDVKMEGGSDDSQN